MLYIIYESQWARLAHAIRIPSGATLVPTGVKRTQAETGSSIRRPRLLITLPFVQRIRSRRNSHPTREDDVMPWATVTLCFFGFFRSGEMTVLSGRFSTQEFIWAGRSRHRRSYRPAGGLSSPLSVQDRPAQKRGWCRDRENPGLPGPRGRCICAFMAQRGTSQVPFKGKLFGNCRSCPRGIRPAAGAVRGA